MDPKKGTENADEGANMGGQNGANIVKKGLKHRPEHNPPQLRLPPALRGRRPAMRAKMQVKMQAKS